MAAETATWTVAECDRLPDDGNRYEVVGGELFVTPAPSLRHQLIADALCGLLKPYVREYQLGIALDLLTDVIEGNRNVVMPDVVVFPLTRESAPPIGATRPLDIDLAALLQ